MVERKVTVEYNSSDKFNSIIKLSQGGLFLSSDISSTSKAKFTNNSYRLIGVLIVSPKEVNFKYNEDVKMVMVFIHVIIKKDSHELLFLHLPISINTDSNPNLELNQFFKSIIQKKDLLQKKNTIHVDELSLNAILFGKKAPMIKKFNNNKAITTYFKTEVFSRIYDYPSITSIIVLDNTNTIPIDVFNKLQKVTNSTVYPTLFTKQKKKKRLLTSIMDTIKKKTTIEGLANPNYCTGPITSLNGTNGSDIPKYYISCKPTDFNNNADNMPFLVKSNTMKGGDIEDSEKYISNTFSEIFGFIANKNVEYAILGFVITILVLYMIYYLYKKLFSGGAKNVLEHHNMVVPNATTI